MAIADADIVLYCSTSMPEDDTSTNGGAIDPDVRGLLTDLSVDDDLEALSSSASDTSQTLTVRVRKPSGAIASQTITMNGTSAVALSSLSSGGDPRDIVSAVLSGDCVGNVTLRRGGNAGDIQVIPAGERGFRRGFLKAKSSPSGAKDYYEKYFLKNNHATLALLNAAVVESADPTSKFTFCLAAAVNGSVTTANRLTAPGASDLLDPDTFDGSSKAVPGTDLAAGAAIGVWVKLALLQNDDPIDSSYTLQMSGDTAA